MRTLFFWLVMESMLFAVPTETFVFLCEAETRRILIGEAIRKDFKNDASPGDAYHVISTPPHKHIETTIVPEGAKGARLKRREVIADFLRLRDWLTIGPLGSSRQLRPYGIPQTIANLRKYPDSKCRIVLVGSPVFLDDHYSGLNMVDVNGNTLVPLDGWLTDTDSPFGPGLYSLPPETTATWITATSLWGPTGSKKHREQLVRFWRLYFESQNDSMLARFSSSIDKVFDFTPDEGFARLHMRQESANVRHVNDATVQRTPGPAEARKVKVVPEHKQQVEDKRSYLPGNCWEDFLAKYADEIRGIYIVRLQHAMDDSDTSLTDADVRVTDNATGHEIWFENPRVKGVGRLYNDVRVGCKKSSDGEPSYEGKYEFICIEPDKDLSDLTLWVNKYLGVEEVHCEVSLFKDGKVLGSQEFLFDTPKGDLGTDADNRGSSKNWKRIDIKDLLGKK